MTLTYGRYRVDRQIGQGGMGVVHLATDTVLNRPVALKVVTDVLASNEEFLTRFGLEADALARLDSPHVIQIFDHGQQDGVPFIATQYVAGGDLGMLLAERGPMPYAAAAAVCAQVAEALDAAHRVGIVHRDVKASNVLVRDPAAEDLFVYLCDFGIAKSGDADAMTRTGGVAGTWAYLSPERADGSPATPASDIYAVGCLLWTCLTGAPPYGGTEPQVIMAHQQAPVPRLETTGDAAAAMLNEVLARSMAKDPARRYADAAELRAGLLSVARTGSGTSAPPAPATVVPMPPTQARPRPVEAAPRKRRGLAVAAVVGALVVAGGVVALVVTSGDDEVCCAPPPTADPTPEAPPVAGDVTGDRLGDVVMTQVRRDSFRPVATLTFRSTGKSLGAAESAPLEADGAVHLADVDGDGLLDLVSVDASEFDEETTVVVQPGSGDEAWTQVVPIAYSTYGATSFPFVTDVDGDGRDDLLLTAFAEGRSGVYVARAGDGTFGEPEQWYAGTTDDWQAAEFLTGDFDGDGRADLLVSTYADAGSEDWVILTSDGTELVPGEPYVLSGGGLALGTPVAADADGDGADEIVLLGGAGRSVNVIEVADGTVTGRTKWADDLGGDVANTYGSYTPSDLDGDGDVDLVRLLEDRTFEAFVSDGSSYADPVPWGALECGAECRDDFSFALLD